MGIFVPGRLGMDEGENILAMVITGDYSGFVLFFFASGKCAKIPLSLLRHQAEPQQSCSRPTATRSRWPSCSSCREETELAIRTSAGRMLLVGTAQIAAKSHPRQPGRGRGDPEKEPDHRIWWSRRTRWSWPTPTATASAACPPPARSSAPRTRAKS